MEKSKISIENAKFLSISRVKWVLKRNRIKNFLKMQLDSAEQLHYTLKERKEKGSNEDVLVPFLFLLM
jgi:hypothetical protein